MSGHNLATVIRFEVVRTLRKPVFWLLTLGVPVLFLALASLSAYSSISGGNAATQASDATKEFVYTDDSGLVDAAVATEMGGKRVNDAAAARQAVQDGTGPAYIAVPKDPLAQPVTVYGKDLGLIANDGYGDLGNRLLEQSAAKQIGSAQLAKLAAGDAKTASVTYRDGVETQGVKAFLPPLAFLVLFFMTITMLGNQMLNITVEEKENRVTEMVLTTVGPTTLIAGKAIAVCIVGLVQAAVFAIPGLITAVALASAVRDSVSLDPVRMLIGFLLFLGGFLQFTGILICLGSVMPSAKEAGGAFAAVMITMFLPLYTVSLLLSQPYGVVSQVLTMFPFTAPITAMLRNAADVLPLWQALMVLVILFGCAAFFLVLGARLFRSGSLAYDQRLNPLTVLRRAH